MIRIGNTIFNKNDIAKITKDEGDSFINVSLKGDYTEFIEFSSEEERARVFLTLV